MDPLQSVEPMAEDVAEPRLQETALVNGHGDMQDPQLARIDSLRVQRDFHNAFDRRLHGSSSSQCKYNTAYCKYVLL